MPHKELRITMKALVTIFMITCNITHYRWINHNERYERALRIVYKDQFSSLQEFFLKKNLPQSMKKISKYLLLK